MPKKPLTILVIADGKDPTTFYIHKRTLYFILFSLVFIVIFGVYSSIELYFSHQEISLLKKHQYKLEMAMSSLQKSCATSKTEKDSIKKNASSLSLKSSTNIQLSNRTLNSFPSTKKSLPYLEDYLVLLENDETKAVQIDDFTVSGQKSENQISVSFKLTKVLKGLNALKGYVVIIASGDSFETTVVGSFPSNSVDTEQKVNYKAGDKFTIRGFKIVKGVLNGEKIAERTKFIYTLVFSLTGELLLKKRILINSY